MLVQGQMCDGVLDLEPVQIGGEGYPFMGIDDPGKVGRVGIEVIGHLPQPLYAQKEKILFKPGQSPQYIRNNGIQDPGVMTFPPSRGFGYRPRSDRSKFSWHPLESLD